MLKSKNQNVIKSKSVNFLIWAIALIPFLYPLMMVLRSRNGMLPLLSSSYEVLNLVKDYSSMSMNELLIHSRMVPFKPFEFILSMFSFSTEETIKVIIVFSSMLLVLLFILLNIFLSRSNVSDRQRALTLLFLVLTPAVIFSRFYSINILISLVLFLIAILAANRIAYVIFLSGSMMFWPLMVIFIMMYEYYLYKKKAIDIKRLRKDYIGISSIFIIYYLIFSFPNTIPFSLFSIKIQISSILADFGNIYGLSLPIFLLSILGFIIGWFRNKEFFMIYLSFLVLFVLSIFFNSLLLPLSFFIAYWCSAFIITLFDRDWEIINLRNTTLFIILCFMLFSSIAFVNNVSNLEPSKKQAEVLIWMKEKGYQGTTLSEYSNSPIIRFFSNNTVYLDASETYRKDNAIRFKELDILFYSRDLKETTALFDKYGIKYVYVDENMKKGKVWTNNDQGLLFLLRNSEMFKNIYNSQGIEVWEYRKSQ